MKVYVLNFDATSDTDYTGHTSVHSTMGGAIIRLDSILTDCGIDVQAARWGEVCVANSANFANSERNHSASICNDPDPDLLDGIQVTYGIIEMEVEE